MNKRTDKELLDSLDGLKTGYGNGWVLRHSSTGRGIRLHESSRSYTRSSVRDAINEYLNFLDK